MIAWYLAGGHPNPDPPQPLVAASRRGALGQSQPQTPEAERSWKHEGQVADRSAAEASAA